MSFRIPNIPWKWVGRGLLLVAVVVAAVTYPRWRPTLDSWVRATSSSFDGRAASAEEDHEDGDAHEEDEHDHGDHGHAHDEATSLELTAQGRRNLGLTDEYLRPVTLKTFQRSITVPAVVVERPGRTRVEVAAPMTGVVTRVYVVEGEAVEPGALLFRIRLTHEDLVQAQTDFLRTLGELDVELREMERLEQYTESGAVPGIRRLERVYAKEKLEALLLAQREALRLHGLSDEQVAQIERERRLVREVSVHAPPPNEPAAQDPRLTGRPEEVALASAQPAAATPAPDSPPLVLQHLQVHKGQTVNAGETLGVLADYSELYIEGLAFEQDADDLVEAVNRGWTVTAVFESRPGEKRTVARLTYAFVSNEVDPDSRTMRFYVDLPNEIVRDAHDDGRRFVGWRFRPGQRLELRVPVEEWPDEIVLPVEALAQEGAEFYVFQQNGDHFDRVAVHVKYRDQDWAVIAHDGALFPGDIVAMRGAHQMQMALKNKAGGGADPHAGHSH